MMCPSVSRKVPSSNRETAHRERRQRRLHKVGGIGGVERPTREQCDGVRVLHERPPERYEHLFGQSRPPLRQRFRHPHFREDPRHHAVEDRVFVGEVVLERHRFHAERPGELAHREALGAVGIDERESGRAIVYAMYPTLATVTAVTTINCPVCILNIAAPVPRALQCKTYGVGSRPDDRGVNSGAEVGACRARGVECAQPSALHGGSPWSTSLSSRVWT